MTRRRTRRGELFTLATIAVTAVALASSAPNPGSAAPMSCHGRVAHVYLPESRYPNIDDHARDAIAGRDAGGKRWPRVLRIHRAGADARRDRATRVLPTRPGMDRDEYPPAVGRASVPADVRYVPSSENRSAGASMGAQLRGLRDGACFDYRYTARP